jgi:hypothetical protein
VQIPRPAKALISRRSLRQCDVAAAEDVNPRKFSRILHRQVEPWPVLRRRLSGYLDASEDELLNHGAVAA